MSRGQGMAALAYKRVINNGTPESNIEGDEYNGRSNNINLK